MTSRELVKTVLMRRFDIERVELDRLVCRHAMVTQSMPKKAMEDLIGKLSPVVCPGRKLIRMGAPKDGGYLVPDDLDGISACFSPGVDYVSKFEIDCANRGMKVYMADRSVDQPAEVHPSFFFIKKYVGALETDEYTTMDQWVSSVCPGIQSDLLLQMDIEGSEYETLLSMSQDLLRRFRIIVIEFHHLDQLWSRPFFLMASRVFEKILLNHRCLHIHPNNCSEVLCKKGLEIPSAMEFTFLRKDRVTTSVPVRDFPHPLDADCTPQPSMVLPACWYWPNARERTGEGGDVE